MEKLKIMGKKILIILIIIITLTLIILSFNKNKGGEAIKIGVIGPFTGDSAEYGENIKKAIDLAVEKINIDGINDGKKIQLIYEDDECKPQIATNAINKLINVDRVNIIIDEACSSVALAEAPIAESSKTILMLATASNYQIKDAGDYVFRVYPSDAFQGKILANLIYNKGHRKVAILHLNNAYGFGLTEVFKEQFKQIGGNLIQIETFEHEATDFRTQLTKIKASNPDALILAGPASEVALILRQIKELNIDLPLFGSDSTKDNLLLDIAGDTAEGLTTLFPTITEGKTYQIFENLYVDKYKQKPEYYATFGYDAMNILASIINKTDSTNTDLIKNGLYSINNFEGATGIINFDDDGERLNVTYDIYTVRNGTFVPETQ